MSDIKPTRFNKLKKEAHGFMLKNPKGELQHHTFVKRKGKTKCGYTRCWYIHFSNLDGKIPHEKMRVKILTALDKGWRVVPVVYQELLELKD